MYVLAPVVAAFQIDQVVSVAVRFRTRAVLVGMGGVISDGVASLVVVSFVFVVVIPVSMTLRVVGLIVMFRFPLVAVRFFVAVLLLPLVEAFVVIFPHVTFLSSGAMHSGMSSLIVVCLLSDVSQRMIFSMVISPVAMGIMAALKMPVSAFIVFPTSMITVARVIVVMISHDMCLVFWNIVALVFLAERSSYAA